MIELLLAAYGAYTIYRKVKRLHVALLSLPIFPAPSPLAAKIAEMLSKPEDWMLDSCAYTIEHKPTGLELWTSDSIFEFKVYGLPRNSNPHKLSLFAKLRLWSQAKAIYKKLKAQRAAACEAAALAALGRRP